MGKTLLEVFGFLPDHSVGMEDPLLSTVEAAERLGVTSRRIVALITSGKLRATRVGRSWVIKASDLAAVQDRPQGWPKGRPRKPG